MREDFEIIKQNFISIQSDLKFIASGIEENLLDIFKDIEHIDRITCRVKSEDSFFNKTLKTLDNGSLKYGNPIQEIQDMVGARIIVYYRNDVQGIEKIIKDFFRTVEKNSFVPDDVKKFGYEGLHFICHIPSAIYSNPTNKLIPDFFELQIKTLYQHAWSQAGHGLGYKPETPLTFEQERKLAFLSAQSWGADTILMDLQKSQN